MADTALEPHYRIRAVARMVGLSEGLIRMWERRHQIVAPTRSASGYRAYSQDDVRVLQRVKALRDGGMPIGDVVAMLPNIHKELAAPSPRVELSASRLADWHDRIVQAVTESDQSRIEHVLDEALAALPPLIVFEQLIVPLQRDIGERWHAQELSIAQEHLVTEVIRRRLITLLHAAPRSNRGHALCACFPDELHEIGLLGAALRFRQAGLRVTYLGARTPMKDIAAMAKTLKPDFIALSASSAVPRKQLQRDLATLMATVPKHIRVIVGGSATERHAKLFSDGGAAVVGPDDWVRLLGTER